MADYQETGKQINKKYFVGLIREQASVKSDGAEINGDFGERLKIAQDNSNLHLKAFRVIGQMNRMEEQKRNTFWDALLLYHDFAQEDLWGGSHVGDLDRMARKLTMEDGDTRVSIDFGEGRTVETTAGQMHDIAESLENARGIGELSDEKHAENQKPKRRGRPPKAEASSGEDPADAAEERGRLDFMAGKSAIVPDDLTADKALHEAYLKGWSGAQVKASRARDAAAFDAAEAKKRGSVLPGADAPGSYALAH